MADDFFDGFNDPFEDIVQQFFGPHGRRIKKRADIREEEEFELGFIESDNKIFLIIEIPGYRENEVTISVKDRRIEIGAQKTNLENVKEYLAQKLSAGITISRTLPQLVNSKKFSSTFRNGVLEVAFDKR